METHGREDPTFTDVDVCQRCGVTRNAAIFWPCVWKGQRQDAHIFHRKWFRFADLEKQEMDETVVTTLRKQLRWAWDKLGCRCIFNENDEKILEDGHCPIHGTYDFIPESWNLRERLKTVENFARDVWEWVNHEVLVRYNELFSAAGLGKPGTGVILTDSYEWKKRFEEEVGE